MVDDSMPHPSISVNCQESNYVLKLDNQMDVDQPKGEFKSSPEDLYDSECHNKYVDSCSTEVNNDFIIHESLDQDCIAEVKETHPDAGFNHVEPSAMFLCKTRADEDIKVQFSADVNLLEHEQPALQERCRETDVNDVKDICIDEGIPVKEKIHAENVFKSPKHSVDNAYYPVKYEEFGFENGKVDAEWRTPVGLKSSTDIECDKDCNRCESKVLIPQSGSENETERLVSSDLLKETVVETLSTQNTAADDSQFKTSVVDGCKDELDMAHKDTLIENEVAIGKLRSSSPTSEETADESKMENSVMETEPAKEATNKSAHTTAVNSKDEIVLSVNHPHSPDDVHLPRRFDPFILASENLTASAPLQRDHFELSFASVGHYAGSITYSGPIAHSGSLSHRSDACTASTRSFTFPMLQNEWNFSPVRMQKADRRRLRRHKGWMHGLFCCKF